MLHRFIFRSVLLPCPSNIAGENTSQTRRRLFFLIVQLWWCLYELWPRPRPGQLTVMTSQWSPAAAAAPQVGCAAS